jgi:hypothetical protein
MHSKTSRFVKPLVQPVTRRELNVTYTLLVFGLVVIVMLLLSRSELYNEGRRGQRLISPFVPGYVAMRTEGTRVADG